MLCSSSLFQSSESLPVEWESEEMCNNITINVPVVYMGRDDMISMPANPYRGPCEGVGSGNRDFFGPLNGYERSECHLGPKKLRFSVPTSSHGPRYGFARIKIITSKRHIKKTGTLVILCT